MSIRFVCLSLGVCLLANEAWATTGFISSERVRFKILSVTDAAGSPKPNALLGLHDAGSGVLTPVAADPPARGSGQEYRESSASTSFGEAMNAGDWTEVLTIVRGHVSPAGDIFCYELGHSSLTLINLELMPVYVEWEWVANYLYSADGDDPEHEESETYGDFGVTIGSYSYTSYVRSAEYPPGMQLSGLDKDGGVFELGFNQSIEVVLYGELYGFANATVPVVPEPSVAWLCGSAIASIALRLCCRAKPNCLRTE
jgi:hypothetical protein